MMLSVNKTVFFMDILFRLSPPIVLTCRDSFYSIGRRSAYSLDFYLPIPLWTFLFPKRDSVFFHVFVSPAVLLYVGIWVIKQVIARKSKQYYEKIRTLG